MSAQNCSISIPGYRVEKDCTLLCRNAKWTDLLLFYLGNYVIHVATIVSEPGASIEVQIVLIISTLMFPFAGLSRGIYAIKSQLHWSSTDLQTAARAGALRMVKRKNPQEISMDRLVAAYASSESQPEIKRTIRLRVSSAIHTIRWQIDKFGVYWNFIDDLAYNEKTTPWRRRRIHGQHRLPPEFKLVRVPPDATFQDDEPLQTKWWQIFKKTAPPETQIASGRNLVRLVASLVQLVFGIYTLYKTRGLQIEQFGYASFGLTVLPYASMSLINLCANILQPDYPALYIVESDLLEMIRRDHPDTCQVTATVGKIKEHTLNEVGRESDWNHAHPYTWLTVASFLLSLGLSLAVIGALTRFKNGSSTTAQRAWTMLWLVFNNFCGITAGSAFPDISEGHSFLLWQFVLLFSVYSTPAMGGLVVVGQMIMQYGTCEEIKRFD